MSRFLAHSRGFEGYFSPIKMRSNIVRRSRVPIEHSGNRCIASERNTAGPMKVRKWLFDRLGSFRVPVR